jgi:hypothetical protein
MQAIASPSPLRGVDLALGAQVGGGFFAGHLRIAGIVYGLIVAPRLAGETTGVWHPQHTDIAGGASCCDGAANTAALAEAGGPLAQWARGLAIEGYTDWYLPSRDELELMYRNLKPTTDPNCCSFRDGDNPSSAPVGYPYAEGSPVQTSVQAFVAGGAEAFEPTWYWSSTQYSRHNAWFQYFGVGNQFHNDKDVQARARAVRRFIVE